MSALLKTHESTSHKWFKDLITTSANLHPNSTLIHVNNKALGGDPQPAALVVAPMVDQSDAPFRRLCLKHGANLCYTPMIHSRMFLHDPKYREKFFPSSHPDDFGDMPAFLQFCANDPAVLLESVAQLLDEGRPSVLLTHPGLTAVDINCGCPQGIAKRGNYGAFLLENEDLLLSIIRTLRAGLPDSVRVTIKVRILPTGVEDSVRLYHRLVDAGVSLLTVHGRTRHQKGQLTGACDWGAIKRVVDEISPRIPVIANGGISSLEDARSCLSQTGALGVISSEAVLEYPAIFKPTRSPPRLQIAREYIELAGRYPPERGGQGNGHKCVRAHLQKMLYADLQRGGNEEIRDGVHQTFNTEDFLKLCDDIEGKGAQEAEEKLEWYFRHRVGVKEGETKLDIQQVELSEDFGACCGALYLDEDGGGGDY